MKDVDQGRARRRRRLRRQASRGDAEDRRRAGRIARRPRAREDAARSRRSSASVMSTTEPRGEPRAQGRRCGHPVHADADARGARHRLHESRQARAGRDSSGRQLGRTRRRSPRCSKQTGLVCMVGHTRRFNPSHQWVHQRIKHGDLKIQQMDVQTYFFRRTNTNALGQPRSWTDHLLWHHAAHTVDLFRYQTGEEIVRRARDAGPEASDSSASRWTCRSS